MNYLHCQPFKAHCARNFKRQSLLQRCSSLSFNMRPNRRMEQSNLHLLYNLQVTFSKTPSRLDVISSKINQNWVIKTLTWLS